MRFALAQLFALALVAAASLVREALGQRIPDLLPFSLYYPVILAAALVGGWPAALTAFVASTVIGWRLFVSSTWIVLDQLSVAVNLSMYVFSAAALAVAGVYVRTLLQRSRAEARVTEESQLRYRALFDAVTDGFALLEVVRDAQGQIVDYIIREANPALLTIAGQSASIVGRRQSELLPKVDKAYLSGIHRAITGAPVTFEWQAPISRRWFEVRLTRISDKEVAQLIHDISARKTADERQTELFDELNHRMKNNLAMVSAMLSLQARMGQDGTVRGHLLKAVDRIQAIADVHASLYRGNRKDNVDFATYLQDLCTRLAGSLLENERVSLKVQAEPAEMPLDRAVALGVVVNELVTNAAKYAYPPPAAGVIDVQLVREPQGLVLSIGDSGAGLPAEPSPSGTGLGMRLVRSLVQQIGATLEVEHHPGATFRVRLPDPSHRAAAGAGGGQARLF